MITQALIPSEIASETQDWATMPEPDISDIVIEDDTPVDNWISEKQQRLLTSSLYSSLKRDEPFVTLANVGLFYAQNYPPLVPDVMVSFGVSVPQDMTLKKNRSYFTWNMGKSPDVAIEIVSNKVGNELGTKLKDYARAGVGYYVVFDHLQCLGERVLSVYQLRANQYHLQDDYWMETLDLGLTLWSGTFEGEEFNWLRWCSKGGNLLLTGDEQTELERQRTETERKRTELERQRTETERQRAETERQRAELEQQKAEQERQRAELEHQRAEAERQRAERLAQLLRERGIDPEQL